MAMYSKLTLQTLLWTLNREGLRRVMNNYDG